jgi:hypothetical protein
MSTKRYKPEQIVNLFQQNEVEIANGKTTPEAAREVGIALGVLTRGVYGCRCYLSGSSKWKVRAKRQ